MNFQKFLFLILLISILSNCEKENNNNFYTRKAYHAGSWYQSDQNLLSKEINQYLSGSEKILKKAFPFQLNVLVNQRIQTI